MEYPWINPNIWQHEAYRLSLKKRNISDCRCLEMSKSIRSIKRHAQWMKLPEPWGDASLSSSLVHSGLYILFLHQFSLVPRVFLYWYGVWGHMLADSMDKKNKFPYLESDDQGVEAGETGAETETEREKDKELHQVLMVCFLYKTLQWYQLNKLLGHPCSCQTKNNNTTNKTT